jgi:hypothetical protein
MSMTSEQIAASGAGRVDGDATQFDGGDAETPAPLGGEEGCHVGGPGGR